MARLLGAICGPEVALQVVMGAFIDFWTVLQDCMNLLAMNKERNSKPDKEREYIDAWTPELIQQLQATVIGIAGACYAHAPAWTEDQRISALYLTAAATTAVTTQCPGHGRDRSTAALLLLETVAQMKHWFHVTDGALLGRDRSVGVEGCVLRMLKTLTAGRATDGRGGRAGEEAFATKAVWMLFTLMCGEAQYLLRESIGAQPPHSLAGAADQATDAPSIESEQTPAGLPEAVPAVAPQRAGAVATPQPSPSLATPPPRNMHTAAPSPPQPVPTQPPDVVEMIQAEADRVAAEAEERRGKQLEASSAKPTPASASSARAGQKRGRGDTCAQDPSATERLAKAIRPHAPMARSLALPATVFGEQQGAGTSGAQAPLMLWLSRDLHGNAAPTAPERADTPPPDVVEMIQAEADRLAAEAEEHRGKQIEASAAKSTPTGASSARVGQKHARSDSCTQDPSATERVAKAIRPHAPVARTWGLPATVFGEQQGAGAAAAEAPLMLWLSRDLHGTCSGAARRRTADAAPAPDLDSLAALLQY